MDGPGVRRAGVPAHPPAPGPGARPQARQHHAGRLGANPPHRLRHRPGARAPGRHEHLPARIGHPWLRPPRAVRRTHGPPHRHLRPGGHALLGADPRGPSRQRAPHDRRGDPASSQSLQSGHLHCHGGGHPPHDGPVSGGPPRRHRRGPAGVAGRAARSSGGGAFPLLHPVRDAAAFPGRPLRELRRPPRARRHLGPDPLAHGSQPLDKASRPPQPSPALCPASSPGPSVSHHRPFPVPSTPDTVLPQARPSAPATGQRQPFPPCP